MLQSTNTWTCLFIVLLSASAWSNPINQNEDFKSMSREEYKYSVWSQIRDMIQLRLDQNENKSIHAMQIHEQEHEHQPVPDQSTTRHFHNVEQNQLQSMSVHQQPMAAQPVQTQQQQPEQINNMSREEYKYSVWSEITNMIQFRLDQNSKKQIQPIATKEQEHQQQPMQIHEQTQHHQLTPVQSANRHFHHVEQNQLHAMPSQPEQLQPNPIHPQQPKQVHQQPIPVQPMTSQKQHQQPMPSQLEQLQPNPIQPQQPKPVHQQLMPAQPMPAQPMPVHQQHQQPMPLLTQPEHEQTTNIKLPVQPTPQSNTINTKSNSQKMERTETDNQSIMTGTKTHLMPGETDIHKPNFHEFLPSQLSTEKFNLLSLKFSSPLFV